MDTHPAEARLGMTHPVETYLKTLSEIHSTGGGTDETSYYPALEALLNEVGAKLKPRVRAVSQLVNTGAGSPDFGLFTSNQFQRASDHKPLKPERGVVEVKGWKDDLFITSDSPQVSKYWKSYGLVLVTNYRDFVLVGKDEQGQPMRLESHRLAGSEKTFRDLLHHPRKATTERGDRFLELPSAPSDSVKNPCASGHVLLGGRLRPQGTVGELQLHNCEVRCQYRLTNSA
jgi:hypothetical protein